MQRHDIVVIGASAGGVEALVQVVRTLPADLAAAVFVVLHIPAHGTSMLPSILNRAGTLPAVHPHDGEPIRTGRIYVAPPDYHLLVKNGHVRLARGPRENGHRPAADPLFRTAARTYGARVVGIVLSGALDDGTAGLAAVKRLGGVAVVQDPADALYPSMPAHALENVAVDHRLPAAAVGPLLVRLADEPVSAPEGGPGVPSDMNQEADMAELEVVAMQDPHRPGTPSAFGCPECGGVLWELRDGELLRFRCRVGHAWSADGLLAEQADKLEAALWTGLRALEENAALSRRLAEQAEQRGYDRAATQFRGRLRATEEHALTIRQVLLRHTTPPESGVGGEPAAGQAAG